MKSIDKFEPRRAGGYAPSATTGGNPYRAWVRRAACANRGDVFDDPARVKEALAVCARCPVLPDCRGWALQNAVDGVAGGLSATARTRWRRDNGIREPRVLVEDFLSLEVNRVDAAQRGARAEPILDAVARLTTQGRSGDQIALALGCSRRKVVRLRAVLRERRLAG